jgi:hypothetical protein
MMPLNLSTEGSAGSKPAALKLVQFFNDFLFFKHGLRPRLSHAELSRRQPHGLQQVGGCPSDRLKLI